MEIGRDLAARASATVTKTPRERDYIAAVLQHHGWRMADAAKALGIQRPNLYRKARQLGIMLTRIAD